MRRRTFLAYSLAVLPSAGAERVFAPYRPSPSEEKDWFNGADLTGWKGTEGYWRVEDGRIVGESRTELGRNEFLWSAVEVGDFYLSIDVRLQPDTGNAGIQFRSRPHGEHGERALGYQADVGKGVWGRLYHEEGRKRLDWRDRGERAVKPGEWNRYEILAVGHRIWTALNGTLAVAFYEPKGELRGRVALQIHAGPPLRVDYRLGKLVHMPRVELAGLTEDQLNAELVDTPLDPAEEA